MEDGLIGTLMEIVVLLVVKDRKFESDHAHHPGPPELVPIALETHS